MSCITRINQKKSEFTEIENKIAQYIIDNKDKIIEMSTQEFAREADVSAASIIRFAKLLGYKGYSSMKIDMAKSSNVDLEDPLMEISQKDSAINISKKLKNLNSNTIEKTLHLMNEDVLNEVIQSASKAKRIYIYGVGASGLVALDLYYKLIRINKAVFYNMDPHVNMINSAYLEKDDFVIGISYSGETNEVLIPLKKAKEKGSKILAIVGNTKSRVGKIADLILSVPRGEKHLRLGAISSRNAALMITDLIYVSIATKNIENINNYLYETKAIIEKLK